MSDPPVPPITDIYDEMSTSDISSCKNLSSFSKDTSPTTSGSVPSSSPSILIPSPKGIPTPDAPSIEMTDSSSAPPKKRKVKLLPPELALLSDNDRSKFIFGFIDDTNPKSKTYGNQIEVAKSVILEDGSEYELSKLTIDQTRSLVKSLGIVNCGSANKLVCFKAIASFFNYQQQLIDADLKPSSHSARVTSSVCRAINIVFSDDFITEFSYVNDRKNRADHENGTTNKLFWIRASDEHNRASGKLSHNQRTETTPIETEDDDGDMKPAAITIVDDDDDDDDKYAVIINSNNDDYIFELQQNKEINLQSVMTYSCDVFKKKSPIYSRCVKKSNSG
jgi:hypothetical protein